MIEFTVRDIEVERYAVVPGLSLKVAIAESGGEPVHSIALRCQVRIDPQRRGYSDTEAAGLQDLFGGRIRWTDTLRPFLWGHSSAMVPGFIGETEVTLPFPLTYDLEVAAVKYLHTVRDGEIPLSLMFSGTAFLTGDNGFRVQQVPWDTDRSYQMPVRVWREAMDQFFPHSGWIRLDTDTLDKLLRVRSEFGLTDWDQTFSALLAKAGMASS
ncbi:MAG: DUF6084 family protein [Actinomycetota bacterium]|nr:DUF6084 family protein [Actinomycetota bacterium]